MVRHEHFDEGSDGESLLGWPEEGTARPVSSDVDQPVRRRWTRFVVLTALLPVVCLCSIGFVHSQGSHSAAAGSTVSLFRFRDLFKSDYPHGARDRLQTPWTPELARLRVQRSLRRGSFLVVGDWGYDPYSHGNVDKTCQPRIGEQMLEKMRELGDVQFIINVGDSFYPNGVESKDDPQWQEKWRNKYHPELRSVPWYSIYGNHDYHKDPCACSPNKTECAQVNDDIKNLDYFYMPDVNYYVFYPDFNMEIVGLDFNKYMMGWNRNINYTFDDCKWTPCKEECLNVTNRRAEEAFDLFYKRHKQTEAKNFVVFSHYPTDYFHFAPEFIEALKDDEKHNTLYLGGHRHSTDNTTVFSTYPNENWLVGGGGGWSCDSDKQGFLVVEVSLTYKLNVYPVYFPSEECCPVPPPTPPSRWTHGCEWLDKDSCREENDAACDCRRLNPDGPCTKCPNSTMREGWEDNETEPEVEDGRAQVVQEEKVSLKRKVGLGGERKPWTHVGEEPQDVHKWVETLMG